VNQAEFPPEIPRARSMMHFSNFSFNIELILSYLCECIEAYYLKWKAGNEQFMNTAFNEFLWGKEAFHEYMHANQNYRLKVVHCDGQGLLHLIDHNEAAVCFNSGNLQLVE
jgi:hypothetical protein